MIAGRRGFTLLELLIAIVVSSIVVLLAYASLQGAVDTRDRLARHRATIESETQLRAIITDALRHPAEATSIDEPVFVLSGGASARGVPRDRVRFLSRGLVPPFGATAPWEVTLDASDSGLVFDARPVGTRSDRAVHSRLPDVLGLRARVLAREDDPSWSERWTGLGRMPAAVELTFVRDPRFPPAAPLVVRVGLDGMR